MGVCMRNIFKTLSILFFGSIFFLSCEIGLGASVDTEAPNLEIQNPSPDAIIRGVFKIGGTWSDDGTIETVTVKLSRTDGKGSEIEYQATFAVSNEDSPNTWNCIINPQDPANIVLDGNYVAQVDITDTGKHTTTKTVQFAIDNTAPVIVLQRPSTKIDALQVDSYGQKFTLEGQAADDNNVSLIEVQIYADKECTTLLHTVPLSNVPNSINLDVAEFKENVETDYSKIYGSTQKSGQKNFYCKVVAYDGAVYYPYDRTQTPEDLKGNKTSIYYLYEDIATAVLGEVKITDVYHILSGVYGLEKESSRSAETNSLIAKVKSTLEKNVVNTGSFSLNPANNPTFSVSGKEPLQKDENGNVNFASGNYDITNGSQVIMEVTPGLDNIPLDGNSLKVYFIECDAKGTAKSGASKIYPATEMKKSGTTYKYTVSVKKQDGLVIGRNYLFGVDGYDEKKNSVVCSDNLGYGFHFSTSGAAPGLTILEPEAGSVTLANGKKLKISGTTTVEAGTPVITITDNKVNKTTLTFQESEATEDENKQLIYTFSTEIDFTGGSAYHELEIVSDLEGIKTTRTKSVSYDSEKPVIAINSVNPIVEKTEPNGQPKKCLNGEVQISFSLTDDFSFIDTTTNKPYFELWQNNEKKYTAIFTSTNSAGTETVTVDTNKLIDNTPLEIKVFTWDRAGNKAEYSDKQYQIDQSTDKPQITPKNNINFNLKSEEDIKKAGNNENRISMGGTVSFTVTDDDGIDYIAVYSQTKDAQGKITETLYNRYPKEGSSKETQTPYSFILPSTSGYYLYRLEVKDIINTKTENNKQEYQFMIKATSPAPTIDLQSEEVASENNTDHNDGYIGVGGSFTNTITIESIESPFKLLEKKVTDKGSVDYTDVTEGTTFEETGNGKYKFTRTVSPTITTTYYYKVEDSNGQSSNEKSVKCKVDNSAPELGTITLPGKADTRTNQFTFRSTAKDPDSGIKIVEMYFSNDGQNYVGPISAEGTENWYYILNFNQPVEALKDIFAINYGEKYVKIKATDKVGLSKETEPQKFFYDTTDPTVTIKSYALNGADNTYTQGELKVGDTSFSLKGTVSDDWKLKNIKITQQKDDADPVEIYSSVINDKEKEWEIKDLPRGADKINAAKESGKYKYVITAIDYAENQTDVSISVTQDITKPVIKIDTLGDFIKTSTLVISGTVEDTSTTKTAVYLLKDGTTEFNKTEGLLLGTDNRFSWTVYEVPDGKYKIKVISEDDFGNKAEETGTEFTVDVTAPTTDFTVAKDTVYDKEGQPVTKLENGSTYYVKDSFTLSGTIKDDNFKSMTLNNSQVTGNSGSWSTTVALDKDKDTTTTQTITLEDKAGNKTVYTLYIAKDTNGPILTVNSPANNSNVQSIKVDGQVYDSGIGVKSVTYEVYEKGKESAIKTETKDTFTFDSYTLPNQGNYTIKVTATDKLNNTRTATQIGIVNDTTPPTISSPTIQNSYIRNHYKVGTGESAVTYTVYGTDTFDIEVTATDLISGVNTVTAESGTTKVDLTAETDSNGKETGKYKGQITAKLDNNNVTVITIKATDKSNNLISQDITNIMVDKVAPELTITSSIPQTTKDSFTVSGTVSDDIALDSDSSPVSVAVKGPSSIEDTKIKLSGSEVSGGNKDIKNWNFAVSTDGLIDGTYTFTIEATDKATNTKKYEFEVLIDKTPPTINKINLPTAQDTKATSFGFTGTASDEGSGVEKIRLTISDGTKTQDEEAVGTINWICQVTYGSEKWKQIFSTEGIKTVTITATDKAGNVTTKTETFTYDTANPTIEIDKASFREFMPKEGLTVPVTVKDSYKLKKLYVEQYFNGQLESTKEYTYDNEDEKTENVEIPFDKNGQKKEPTDGEYTYIFKVTDDVGNVTETTFDPVKYDDTKPEITILNPSGKTEENAIDSTSYKFEGTIDEKNLFGIYYKIAKKNETSPKAPSYENQDGWTQVSVSGSGTSWNFYQSFCKGDETETEGTLKEGSYTVYLYAIDKAANVSEPLTKNFDVDLAAPTLTSALTSTHITDTNASIVYFNGNLQLSGTVTDTNGLAENPIKIEKGGITYTVTKTDDNYSAEISESEFIESTNETITITATDIVGKKTTKTYTVRLDKTPPTIEVISPTNGENISSATKQLRGTVSDSHSGVDASKVTYKLFRKCNSNNFKEEEVSSGTIKLTGESFNITDFKLFKDEDEDANSAKEGTFTLTVDAEDKLGNKATQSQVVFYYDKAAPELSISEITSPTNKDIKIAGKCWDSNEIESVTIYVDNTVEEEISFEKNERPITKPENNNIDKTYSLDDGEHTIKIVAKDISGNEKQETQTIIVDKTPPTIEIDNLPTGAYEEDGNKWYNKTNLSLTGKLNDSNSGVKTSGIKSVQYKLNNSESMVDVSFSSVKWNATVMGLKEGLNTVILEVTDNAGNKSQVTTSFYVDSKAPETLKVVKIDSLETSEDNSITSEYEKLTNKKNEITLVLEASDVNSGEGTSTGLNDNAIEITKIGSTVVSIKSPKNLEGKFVITIPVDSINDGTVKASVTDKAGNKSNEFELFIIKLDNKYPTVKINKPSDANENENGIQINKTVTLSGTVSDNNVLEANSLKLQYSKDNGTNWYDLTGKDSSAVVQSNDGLSWTAQFDTTQFTADNTTKTIKLRALAKDTAGNEGNSGNSNINLNDAYSDSHSIEVIISQDSDRPKISFNNVTLGNSMSSSDSNYIWLKNTTVLYGTVEDDDGISSMQISKDGTNWKDVTLNTAKTSWSFDIKNFITSGTDEQKEADANGAHQIYFKVTDAKNQEFTSATTSSLSSVYLVDGENKYGTIGSSPAKPDSVLYVKVDTLAPEVVLAGARIGESGDFSTAYSNMTLGGSQRTMQFKLTAKDSNGIEKISGVAEFDGTSIKLEKPEVKAYKTGVPGDEETTVGASDVDYYIVSFDVDLDSAQSGLNGKDGRISLKFTGKDKAGNSSAQTATINYDYKKPEVTITSPKDSSWVSGIVTAYGTIDSASTMYYALSPSDSVIPAEPDAVISGGNISAQSESETSTSHQVTSWSGTNPETGVTVNGTINVTPKYAQIKGNGVQWFVYFDNQPSTDIATHDVEFKKYLTNYGITTEDAISGKSFTTIVKLYLWIKSIDTAGNITEVKFPILIDPQGDAPQVTISYPAKDGETLGGAVTLLGTASDTIGTNIGIKNVWVQIMSDKKEASATPTKDDVNLWINNNYDVYTGIKNTTPTKVTTAISDSATPADYYIQATVSGTSWSLKINANDEFSPNEGNTKNVTYRIYAQDNDNNLSKYQTQYCIFDADNPILSDLYLRQYSDNENGRGDITASRPYEDDMWIKGDWWLCGTVTDTQGIKSLTVGGENQNPTGNAQEKETFKYKISTNGIDAGNRKISIIAEDNAEGTTHKTQKECSINFDNKAPVSKEPVIAANRIQNANGFFTFSAEVTEDAVVGAAQSGFKYLAFYFTRGNNVYDIMRPKADGKSAIDKSNTTSYPTEDGLIWKKMTVTRSESNLAVITLDSADDNIHTGGLCKIGGSIYMIKNASGTTIELDGSPEMPASGTSQEALFAIANVVNNNIESGNGTKSTSDDYYGYFNSISNDDGDHMVESVLKTGTTWKWEANINSRNIPDGEVTLHYVAFDAAGNYSSNEISGLQIANNAPRLASLKVWTDYNGNGKQDANEFDTKYYSKKTVVIGGKSQTKSQDLTSDLLLSGNDKDESAGGSAFMTVKAETKLIPELVGGNGDLYYTYRTKPNNTEKWSNIITKSDKSFATGNDDGIDDEAGNGGYYLEDDEKTGYISGTVYDGTNGKNPIVISTEMLGNLENNTGNDNPTWFEYTIYDSTEGCADWNDADYTKGRLSAKFKVALNVQYNDEVKPQVAVRPFYWNSKTDNSVCWDSTTGSALGHIELEGDLTQTITDALGDDDPKVSGKIKIEGYAFDNIKLKELYVQFAGHKDIGSKTLAATYTTSENTTSWVKSSTAAGIGNTWDFAATDVFNNSEGHLVYWTLTVDTQAVSGQTQVARLDQKVTVIAKDERGKQETTTGGLESASSEDDIPGKQEMLWKDVKTYAGAATMFYTDEACTIPVEAASDDTPVYLKEKWDYQMDIVPYITGVNTSLSTLDRKTPSKFDRTALGHYPVRIVTKAQNGSTNQAETVTFTGFNLGSNTSLDVSSLKIEDDSTTGGRSAKYSLSVNDIPTLNNMNNNDAKGSYSGTISDDSSYNDKVQYAYNRQPNNANNNRLTDDIIFDVWEFNSVAAEPISGKIEQPVMKIRPTDGKIGFAFVNGPLYFSMGGSESSQNYSYQYWMASYDFFTSVGFTYDDAGNSWGVAAGGDINSAHADKFQLMSSKWGLSQRDKDGSYSNTNSMRLESIGMLGTKVYQESTTENFDKQRIRSPSLAATDHGSNTNLYLAYYDAMNDELRFKAGREGRASYVLKVIRTDTPDSNYAGAWVVPPNNNRNIFADGDLIYLCDKDGNLSEDKYYTLGGYYKSNFGSSGQVAFVARDSEGNDIAPFPGTEGKGYTEDGNFHNLTDDVYIKVVKNTKSFVNGSSFYDFDTTNAPYSYRNSAVNIVAGDGTPKGAGEYVSLGVVPGTTAADDVVVITWYDTNARTLYYSYNTTPLTNRSGIVNQFGANDGWFTPVPVFEGKDYDYAGEYCKIAVDKNGGIHIAAYDPVNLDLVYAYASNYSSGFETCVVDSNGVVGSNLTLDVALDDNNKAVPFIGYYATSCIKPKYARFVGSSLSGTIDGSKNDEVTGKWEISVVPTDRVVEMQSNQHNDINIGVWKDSSSGSIKESSKGGSSTSNTSSGYSSTSNGQIFGNGTKNPVLGYAIKYGSSSDTIETAQMK